MSRLRWLALSVGLCLFLAPLIARGADEGKRPERKPPPGPGAPGGFGPLLPPPDILEKLKLSEEQKDKVAKLQKAFEEKNKDAFSKIREGLDKARQDKDREKFGELNQSMQKLQGEFEGQFAGVLNDEQKKQFDEFKRQGPRFGPGGAPGGPGGRPGFGTPPGPMMLPPEIQERLKLSEEQRDKLAKLQKEIEEKINGILTEEQKKQYEEMKKNPPGVRPLERPKPPERKPNDTPPS